MTDLDAFRGAIHDTAKALGARSLSSGELDHLRGLTLDMAGALEGDERKRAQVEAYLALTAFHARVGAYLELQMWRQAIAAGIMSVVSVTSTVAAEIAGLALVQALDA